VLQIATDGGLIMNVCLRFLIGIMLGLNKHAHLVFS
jgi:hypothetical protein